MCLDFVLPGTDIELTAGGQNVPLTIANVEEYLCAVVNYTLREGGSKLYVSKLFLVFMFDRFGQNVANFSLNFSIKTCVFKSGVRKQMEALRYGFSLVMPLSNLQLFYANEMSQLLCGTGLSI